MQMGAPRGASRSLRLKRRGWMESARTFKICKVTRDCAGSADGSFHVDRSRGLPGKGGLQRRHGGVPPNGILLSETDDFGATWSAPWDVPMAEEIGPPKSDEARWYPKL